MPAERNDLRELVWALPAADRMAMLTISIGEKDNDAVAFLTGLLSLMTKLSTNLSQSKKVALVSALRDCADLIERPLLVENVLPPRR